MTQESTETLSLAEVARRLDGAGLIWVVFAGAAATVYGADRPVTDVDILTPAAAAEQLTALFPEGTVRPGEERRILGVELPGFDLLAGLAMEKEDTSYRIDVDDEMAARRRYGEIDGVVVPVIPPEDNILLKAILRRGPEEGKHDLEDVQAMMTHFAALDWEYLHWRLETCCSGPGMRRVLELLAEEVDG
ncbi:MAG: hypothetical protein PVH62_08210 [Anaerolineae bacterium]|jgi:hypothetical protein